MQGLTLAARTEEEDQREEEDETMAARMEDGAPQSDPSQAKRIICSPAELEPEEGLLPCLLSSGWQLEAPVSLACYSINVLDPC